MDKAALRRAVGERKRGMTADEIEARSALLAERLFRTERYRATRALYAYLSYNQEVRTAPILRRAWADGKRTAVPKLLSDGMRFIWLDGFDRLRENRFGIPEPIDDSPVADDPEALILAPGVAFDRRGYRVGYGGGCYDRYLASHPGHPTVALCYDFQLVDAIEPEPFDLPVDLVISESRMMGG